MAEKITTYVLDACGLIAYLREEEGNEKVKGLFKSIDNKFFMHAVNVGEVYYDTLRTSGQEKARELFRDLTRLPINIIWTLDVPLLEIVGKYKTSFKVSYADSFVLALAERESAIVISTDHHEFDTIEKAGTIPFYWLR